MQALSYERGDLQAGRGVGGVCSRDARSTSITIRHVSVIASNRAEGGAEVVALEGAATIRRDGAGMTET